jgi:hypothetical protein
MTQFKVNSLKYKTIKCYKEKVLSYLLIIFDFLSKLVNSLGSISDFLKQEHKLKRFTVFLFCLFFNSEYIKNGSSVF